VADVLCEQRGNVALVTLNRPTRRNALSSALLIALRATMAELDAQPGVGAIVLTGADPAFCAGLDLTELGQPDSPLVAAGSGAVLPPLSTPLIGAVNGAAVTGGLELALACDFLIASERATFADTHARVGIMPGWGMTYALPEAVGVRRARQLSATGNFIDARTALTWGLVNHVVAHGELVGFTVALAADVATNDTAAVKAIFAAYQEQVIGEDAAGVEARARARWNAAGIDRAEVTRRRDAVIEHAAYKGVADTVPAVARAGGIRHPSRVCRRSACRMAVPGGLRRCWDPRAQSPAARAARTVGGIRQAGVALSC
jgi:enoyl-CoA hydratase